MQADTAQAWAFDADPRFDVEVVRRGPVFYSVRIVDTTTGARVPVSGGGLLTGRSSVRRAVHWSTRRYLLQQPTRVVTFDPTSAAAVDLATLFEAGGWPTPPVRLRGLTSRCLLVLGWTLRGVGCLFLLLVAFATRLPGGAHVWAAVGAAGCVTFVLVGFLVTAWSGSRGRARADPGRHVRPGG